MSLREIQNFFHHLCLDKKFVFDRQTLTRFVAEDTASFLLEQPHKKQTVYRDLVENNISSMIFLAFPLTFHFLSKSETQTIIRDFMSVYKARSIHYRHIPYDFFEYTQNAKIFSNSSFGFLAELSDYEFTAYDLLFRDHDFPLPQSSPDLELAKAKIVLNPHLSLKKYNHAVHQITKDTIPLAVTKQKTNLILYRHVDTFHQSSFVLNDLTCSLIEILLKFRHADFETCLQHLLEQNSGIQDEAAVREAVVFLKELLDKQIVLALV